MNTYSSYGVGVGEPVLARLLWFLVAAVALCITALASWVDWVTGMSLLIGVAVLPVADLIGDVVWRLSGNQGAEAATAGWWITYGAVIVMIVTIGSMVRSPGGGGQRLTRQALFGWLLLRGRPHHSG
jgi:hypothetical protein